MTRSLTIRSGVVGSGREPLVCTPLVGQTREAIRAELGFIVRKEPDIIEWRADFFRGITSTASVLEIARDLRDGANGIPIVFTVRSAREGGEPVPLNDEDVTALEVAVCEAHAVEFIDFEMSGNSEHREQLRAAARGSDTKLILSYHNFRETPEFDGLYAKFLLAQELGADIAKVAVMPKDLSDVLTLLSVTLEAHRNLEVPLISISMGAYGVLTRMFGWVFGSSVTFAVGQASSAPGQVPIEELTTALAILQRALAGK